MKTSRSNSCAERSRIGQCGRKGLFPRRRSLERWLDFDQRREIIFSYLQLLEEIKGPMALDSDLHYPKDLIRRAILEEILENPNGELRSQLEIAYVQLESFVTYEEHRIIAEFKAASMLSQEMADTRDPTSIIKSVKMVKRGTGDHAVKIQEKISENMRQRMAQIRRIGSKVLDSGQTCCMNTVH